MHKKGIVIFLLAICATEILAQENRRKLVALTSGCFVRNRVSKADVDRALRSAFCSRTPKTDCFMACVGRDLGLIDEIGYINPDGVSRLATISPRMAANAGPILDYCSALKGIDACDTAGLIMECACRYQLAS